VIDKSQLELWQAARAASPKGYDVVMDPNGAETLRQSYKHLAPAGRLVIYGFHTMMPRTRGRPNWLKVAYDWLRTPRFSPFDMTDRNRSVLAFNVSYLFERADILERGAGDLLDWLERGQIRALPVRTFAFDAVQDAHRAIESGQTVGKLVLVM
jgi:NADPH:quinone reductase-like Zn-dependent oxidoreductase